MYIAFETWGSCHIKIFFLDLIPLMWPGPNTFLYIRVSLDGHNCIPKRIFSNINNWTTTLHDLIDFLITHPYIHLCYFSNVSVTFFHFLKRIMNFVHKSYLNRPLFAPTCHIYQMNQKFKIKYTFNNKSINLLKKNRRGGG